MKKKLRGFTLIELIVVIAIIGVLAAILIPSMLAYVKNSKVTEFNANARSIYAGAQLAITAVNNAGGEIEPNTVYICSTEGSGICVAAGSSEECDIADYLGEDFQGYFGFMTDTGGTGCVYAMWSEQPLTADMFQEQMTDEDVKKSFSATPRGCHPRKA